MLGVARLVEERMPVVGAADRLDDEHDAAGNLDRRAERARATSSVATRCRGGRSPAPAGRSRGPRASPRARAASRSAGKPCPIRWRGRARGTSQRFASSSGIPTRRRKSASSARDVQILGLVEEALALGGELLEREAEALVELAVGRARRARRVAARAVPRRCGRGARSGAPRSASTRAAVEPLAPAAVGLVRDRRAEEPVADLLAVHGGRRAKPRARRSPRRPPGSGLRGSPRSRSARARRGAAALDLGRRGERAGTRRESSDRRSARRSARARTRPSGPRNGGSTPRRARR